MFCKNCGYEHDDGMKFCKNCGSSLTDNETQQVVTPVPEVIQPEYTNVYSHREITEEDLPDEFRPIGAWGYFGYQLLFCIPLVGFILLIVFAAGGTRNKNLKNFAASHFCGLLIAAIAFGVILLFSLIVGGVGVSMLDF